MIAFALKRLLRKPGLALLALAGVVLPVAVLTSGAFFARAVDRALLWEELSAYNAIQRRPPLAIRTYAYGTPELPLSLTRAEGFLDTVGSVISSQTGLSVVGATLRVQSGRFTALTPGIMSQLGMADRTLGVAFAYYPGIAGHVEVIAGSPLLDEGLASAPPWQPVPVWLRADMADELRVRPGDRFPCEAQLFTDDPELLAGIVQGPLDVEVAGLWALPQQNAAAPSDALWFGRPEAALTGALLVSRADYLAHIEPRQEVKIHHADWDLVLDLRQTAPAHVQRYTNGFLRALAILKADIPSTLYDDPRSNPCVTTPVGGAF